MVARTFGPVGLLTAGMLAGAWLHAVTSQGTVATPIESAVQESATAVFPEQSPLDCERDARHLDDQALSQIVEVAVARALSAQLAPMARTAPAHAMEAGSTSDPTVATSGVNLDQPSVALSNSIDFVNGKIAEGAWRDADRETFRDRMATLDVVEQDEILTRLITAMNDGRIVVEPGMEPF